MGGNRNKKVNSNIKSVCKSKRKPKSPGSVKSDLSGISLQCLGGSPTILNSPLRHSNSVNKLLCVPGCSYGGRQGNAEMFKCCLCMQWVHPICCGDSEDDAADGGIYNCSLCRTLTVRLSNIETQLKACHELNTSLVKLVQQSKEECENLRCVVSRLTLGDSQLIKSHQQSKTNPSGISHVSRASPAKVPKLTVILPDKDEVSPEQNNCGWSVAPTGPKSRPLDQLYSSPLTTGISLQNRFSALGNDDCLSVPESSKTSEIRETACLFPKRTPKRTNQSPGHIEPEVPAPANHFAAQQANATQVPASQVRVNQAPTSRAPTREAPTRQVSRGQASVRATVSQTRPEATMDAKCSTKPRVLVIGNSMIRNTGHFLSKKLQNVDSCVYSTSGYSLDRAIAEVPQMVNDFNKFDTVVLCLGTADIIQNEVTDIATKYCILIGKIRNIAPECNILISAVAYRLHENSQCLNESTDFLNSSLRLLCSRDSKCIFVDMNPSATQENYLEDGLHFNYRGRRIFEGFLVSILTQERNFPQLLNQPSR